MSEFCLLALSLRGHERVPTVFGRKLDRQRVFDGAYPCIFTQPQPLFENAGKLDAQVAPACFHARFTTVMRTMIGSMFSHIWQFVPENKATVRFRLEGEDSTMRIESVLAARSKSRYAGGVEGDDLLILLYFRRIDAAEAGYGRLLQQRLRNAGECWEFLQALEIVRSGPKFSDHYPSGFSLLYADRFLAPQRKNEVETWLGEEQAQFAACLVGAYLFYCNLICQRTERLAVDIDINADWDTQMRKLILARKKLVVARKYAQLKNRASPDSPILPIFWGISEVLRIEEQIRNLSELLDETAKALETQSSYVASDRLRAIELIVFVSTILGLGVGLNAIQMAPFYDAATNNVLGRPFFWMVFTIVLAAALLAWFMFVFTGRLKRLLAMWWNRYRISRKDR